MSELVRRTRGLLVIAGIVLVILMPTLALPLGPDSSMFYVSAQKILAQGAVHYRDVVDVKPPLIYYLYAIAIGVLGDQPIAIRIADLLLQLATCLLLVRLVRRCGGSVAWAATAGVLYALLYGSLGYAHTMQVESYLGLILAGIAWLQLVRRTTWSFVAAGALAGIATLLKFPFAVAFGLIVLGEWLVVGASWRIARRTVALATAGFIGVLAMLLLYVVANNAGAGFIEVSEFIAGYARTKGRGPGAFATELVRELPSRLIATLSATVLIATLGALVEAVRSSRVAFPGDARPDVAPAADRGTLVPDDSSSIDTAPNRDVFNVSGSIHDGGREDAITSRRLLRFTALALGLLVVSLIVEGKYYPYQMSRLGAAAAIIGAYGIVACAAHLWRARRTSYGFTAGVVIAAAAIAFSPIPSWLWFSIAPVAAYARGGEAGFDAYFDRMSVHYPRTELKAVGRAIRAARKQGDEVLALSSIGALVHHNAGSVPTNRIYHSAFLLAEFAPAKWRAETRRYALERRPAFIVVQRGDVLFELTGNERSSDALVGILGLDSAIATTYGTLIETKRFTVYRRAK